jgi:hypothetical protein
MRKRLLLTAASVAFAGLAVAQQKFNKTNIKQIHRSQTFYGKAVNPVEPKHATSGTHTNGSTLPGKSTSITNYTLEPVPLGSSVNAYMSLNGQRTNFYVDPVLQTIAFTRRGGPDDPAGVSGNPGNKLFYDYSPDGGTNWDISKGILYNDDNYQDLASGANNYGARYPQGLIWNPPGNTDAANAFQTGFGAILTGSNDVWGGLSFGSNRIGGGTPSFIGLIDEDSPLRQTSNALAVNGAGKIIHAEIEVDLNASNFTGRVIMTSFTVNATNGVITPEVSFITLPDDGSDTELRVADMVLSFGPDGNTGYLSMLARLADATLCPDKIYYPVYYKTTDGGATWVGPVVYSFTDAANCVGLRNAINGDSGFEIDETTGDTNFVKLVYSTAFEHDAVVDKNGALHMMLAVCYSGARNPLDEALEPNFSISTTDMHIVDLFQINSTDSMQYAVLGIPKSFRGAYWNDEPDIPNDHRYQTSRNRDGSKLFFTYIDTDVDKYDDQVGNLSNKNILPDLFLSGLDFSDPDGNIFFMKNRNVTDGSDVEASLFMFNASPFVLENAQKFEVPVNFMQIGAASTSPVNHIYIGGVAVSATSDTIFVHDPITYDAIIISNKPVINAASDLKVYPNPSANYIALAGNTADWRNADFAIFNTLGQQVMAGKIPVNGAEPRVEVQSLKPGIYTLSLMNNSQKVTRKFIKQ